jgi:hypothetical protein
MVSSTTINVAYLLQKSSTDDSLSVIAPHIVATVLPMAGVAADDADTDVADTDVDADAGVGTDLADNSVIKRLINEVKDTGAVFPYSGSIATVDLRG